jgi:hypothetical protein
MGPEKMDWKEKRKGKRGGEEKKQSATHLGSDPEHMEIDGENSRIFRGQLKQSSYKYPKFRVTTQFVTYVSVSRGFSKSLIL